MLTRVLTYLLKLNYKVNETHDKEIYNTRTPINRGKQFDHNKKIKIN